jgi:hypothetical protein
LQAADWAVRKREVLPRHVFQPEIRDQRTPVGLRHGIRLALTGTDHDWLDFYDGGRLAAFSGNTDLLADSYSSAVNWLQQAVGELAPDAT